MKTIGLKVYVAMSGGVDSSVAAALLKKQGFDVIGVFFKPWSPQPETRNQKLAASFCDWEQDKQDAMRVCAKLDIPFKTWDFSKEYEKEVVRYMIDSYRIGITPNPDVMCNKEIKFGLFLKKALAEGADYIATGHYARIAVSGERLAFRVRANKISSELNAKRYTLYTGTDRKKDQSYFLWTLMQKQLKHCLFPIGDYTKPKVRKLAKKFGLPNHDKKDSQGVCFVGQLNMKEFLKNYIKPSRGEIRLVLFDHNRSRMKPKQKESDTVKTKIVGYHDGVYYYTIGQRHGLDIKDGRGPYYVARKDIKKNILYVAQGVNSKQLTVNSGAIGNVNWIGEKPKLPLSCQVKIRYRAESVPATITMTVIAKGAQLYEIKFKKPVRALAPGQSAVFYRGQEVLGGGVILNPEQFNDSEYSHRSKITTNI